MRKIRIFSTYGTSFLTTLLITVTLNAGELVPLYPKIIKNPDPDNAVQQPPFTPQTDDYLNHTDNNADYYLGSGALDDTFFVVFEPVAACSVYYAEVQWYTAGNYTGFAALYSEEALTVFPSGQAPERGTTDISPIGQIINGFIPGSCSGTQDWEILNFGEPFYNGNPFTIEPEMFGIGFIKGGDDPRPLADAVSNVGIDHTYTWFGGPWMPQNNYEHIWGAYSPDFTGVIIEVIMRVWVLYLNGYPIVSMALRPENLPIVIPANGGSFNFNFSVTNNYVFPVSCDIWTIITLPNWTGYGPLIEFQNISIPSNWSGNRDYRQYIPVNAPPGTYYYSAFVGEYPDFVWNEVFFEFEKSTFEDGSGTVSDWEISGGSIFGIQEPISPQIPREFALHPPRPNPFNPTTTVSYQLSADGIVNLTICDINGREVAKLADGYEVKGLHEVTFDGSDLSSGVYFAILEAIGEKQVQKLVLMK